MELTCKRCHSTFDSGVTLAYCEECRRFFHEQQIMRINAQNPRPGLHITGKFLEPRQCPGTTWCDVSDSQICGLCGSDELDTGYGYAGGYGLGCYNYCMACNSVLDFCEDMSDHDTTRVAATAELLEPEGT